MIEVAFHEHPATREQLGENLAAAAFLAYRAGGVLDDTVRTLESFVDLDDTALAALLDGAAHAARVFGAMIYYTDTEVDTSAMCATAREWARRQL